MADDTEKSRCKWILAIAAMLATQASITRALSTQQLSQRKPHVILIVADDLGWNDVPWTNPEVLTPNLETLASEGVIMNQTYVLPICSPTRAALLTGRYPFTMGLQGSPIAGTEPIGVPLGAKMLPEVLKEAGYQTHAVGKWHLGFCSWDYTPTHRGFDSFYGFYLGGQDYLTHKKGTTQGPVFDNSIEYLDLRNNTAPDDGKDGVYSTSLFGSVAEDIVRGRNPDDPMFLYLAFQAVHSPLQVPDQYLDLYSNVADSDRKKYLGMVSAMDDAVGKVVTALKETGHYDNSVIIFTSDNGGSQSDGGSNAPLRGRKGTLFEGGTRAAAFVHSPFLPNSGSVTSQLLHVTDWYTTIASITGANPPTVDGVNQWDAIVGGSSPPRDTMVYNIYDSGRFSASVRSSDYKMIVGNIPMLGWESSSASPETTYTVWRSLRRNRAIGFNRAQRLQLNEYLNRNTEIRLFNIREDPAETQDKSSGNEQILGEMLKYLSTELQRYVTEDEQDPDPSGHPVYWNNVWSPGWCEAQ